MAVERERWRLRFNLFSDLARGSASIRENRSHSRLSLKFDLCCLCALAMDDCSKSRQVAKHVRQSQSVKRNKQFIPPVYLFSVDEQRRCIFRLSEAAIIRNLCQHERVNRETVADQGNLQHQLRASDLRIDNRSWIANDPVSTESSLES